MRYPLTIIAFLVLAGCASRLPQNPAVIGMTEEQVKTQTNWGNPWSVRRTITANGVTEQWVYRNASGYNQYLYFTNGKLTAIQN